MTADRERYLYWCRCKLGEGRWYWVIAGWGEDGPLVDGIAGSEAGAEAAAGVAAARLGMTLGAGRGPRVPGEILKGNAGSAAHWYSDKCKARRRARVSHETGSRVREFLYVHHLSDDYRDPPYWSAHPILKKTPKRIWVAVSVSCPVKDLGTDKEAWYLKRLEWDDRVTVLDRAALERDGHAGTRRRWYVTFYLKPEFPWGEVTAAGSPALAGALGVLGLSWPCSTADVKRAYRRLSRETHPDVGGSAEEFRRVNEAYERVAGAL
jgi:hypothetical protein